MRARIAAATLLVFLAAAAPAVAGDPILPLSQVHAGMRCTGYSVVRGTDISSFDVEVIDVVSGDPSENGARILVRVSGPAVDVTGIGPGFSGSPIYCDAGDGTSRSIGAISESIGDYGGKVVLATPIESILATPVDGPAAKPVRGAPTEGAAGARASGTRAGGARAVRAAGARAAGPRGTARERALLAKAKPLAAPLMVTGVSPRLGAMLSAAGRKAGRVVLSAPVGPLASFAPQLPRPGSAVSVGLSNGDLAVGGIGTVAYVDGTSVWAFGHPMDGFGRRSLLLQDAYVFSVIGNPISLPEVPGTYKLAAPGHDLGTISDDGLSAVAGRVGGLPRMTPVRVYATDEDTGATSSSTTQVADEAPIGQPGGTSALSFIAPTAIAQTTGTIFDGSPARLTGTMCARIVLRERSRPLRFCNRYVTGEPDLTGLGNPIAGLVANDVLTALGMIDAYKVSDLEVREVSARVKLQRGMRQAFMRSIKLPRRVRPGQRVRARVSLQVVRGPKLTRTYSVRLPGRLKRGSRRLTFVGTDADAGESAFDQSITLILDDGEGAGESPGGDPGPASVSELADEITALGRYDGVGLRSGGDTVPAFRDAELRLSGRVRTTVRVVR
jgi:hypothetical protein